VRSPSRQRSCHKFEQRFNHCSEHCYNSAVRDVADTPSRLIAAAERLFAEGGEEATSLRAVTRAALSSAAAVHYHFGGRDGLLRAVLDRHLDGRQDRRLKLLARAVEQHGDEVPVPVLLAAILRPDLELLAKLRKHRVQVARFLGRAFALRSPAVAEHLDRQFQSLADRVLPLLSTAVPGVSVDELRLRLHLVLDGVAMLYATAPDRGEPGPLGTDDVDEQVRRLVAFTAAGMAAPPGSRTATRVRRSAHA
jgi:AcrR family transcriptional regulator